MTRFVYTNQFADVNSDVVNWVHYNRNTRVLAVTTLNGSTYMYADVSQNTYKNFLAAQSRGAFWNYDIKTRHKRTPESNSGALSNVAFVRDHESEASDSTSAVLRTQDFAVHAPTGASFEVVVELNGTLTIKGEASDGAAALVKVHEILAETFKGDYKVRELKQKFD